MNNQIQQQKIEEVLPVDEVVIYADNIDMDTQQWKERVMRCKMICLHKMNLSLTTNPKYMGRKEKADLLKIIEAKMLEPSENIMTEFNDLVCDELLHQDSDYSRYPVYCQPSQHKIVPVIPPIFQPKEEDWEDETKKVDYYEVDCGGNEVPMKDSEIEKLGLNL